MAFQVRKSPFEFRDQGTHVQSELNQSRLKGKVQVELIESPEGAAERLGRAIEYRPDQSDDEQRGGKG